MQDKPICTDIKLDQNVQNINHQKCICNVQSHMEKQTTLCLKKQTTLCLKNQTHTINMTTKPIL